MTFFRHLFVVTILFLLSCFLRSDQTNISMVEHSGLQHKFDVNGSDTNIADEGRLRLALNVCTICIIFHIIDFQNFLQKHETGNNDLSLIASYLPLSVTQPFDSPTNLAGLDSAADGFYTVTGNNYEMGRPRSVSDTEAVELIQKYIHYFKTDDFPQSNSQCWKDMSNELDGRWKPHSVYTHVRENKNGHLDAARRNLGIVVQSPLKTYSVLDEDFVDQSSNYSESSESSYHDDENEDPETDVFPLTLSSVEWALIKPDEASNEKKKKLKSRIWPNVITKAFWNKYKFSCAFIGKWSHIRSEETDHNDNCIDLISRYFLKFKGVCRSKKCSNVILGTAIEKPIDGKLKLMIKTRDTRVDYHEEVKRPLNGPQRKSVAKELKRRRVAGYRQNVLSKNMEFGENEPPWISKSNVLRQAKMEQNKEDLGITSIKKMDMISNIQNMMQNFRYAHSIREIGAKKFFVFYCSPEQVFIEKEYCRIKKGSSQICLDATGKVVKKFEIFPGHQTGHIFLYTITINFEGKTLPVYQMLSEKHDASFISFWLREWIRECGATIPDEAMADLGRALLLAMCEAFNRMTLKEYVDVLFSWAINEGHKLPRPFNTVIRADFAHQMAAVARWKCIQNLRHPIVKGFYLRTVALMIDCQTIREFENIFRLTCIVALHLDQNQQSMASDKAVSVFEARRLLEESIVDRRTIIEKLETSISNIEHQKEATSALNLPEDKSEKNVTLTHQWIKSIIRSCTPLDQSTVGGDAVNSFYFPEFIQSLERIAKEFPIWTAAALPGIQSHATTASQEGYFAEMRNRIFEGINLPCSANRFLKEHIDDLHSGTNEVATKLKHFNHNHRMPILSSSKTDRNSDSTHHQENFAHASTPTTRTILTEKPKFILKQNIKKSQHHENFIHDSTPTSRTILSEEPKLISKQNTSTPVSTFIEPRSELAPGRHSARGSASTVSEPLDFDVNSELIGRLIDRPRTLNDSDLTSGETWKGLINEKTSFTNANEAYLEEHNVDHVLITKIDQYILTESVDSSTDTEPSDINLAKPIFLGSPLISDHNYSKSIEEDIPTESKKKMGPKIKNKTSKEGFYFQPHPQIKFVNARLENRGKKGFLLKNGSKTGIMKINNISVDLQQTCGFDAIVHIVQFGAIYDAKYLTFLQSSSNRTLKFIRKLINVGPSAEVLRERILLLNEFYPLVKDSNAPTIKPHKLIAEDSITSIWKYLFAYSESTEPSATIDSTCDNPHCISSLPTDVAYLDVNGTTINSKGIGSLQDAIKFHKNDFNVKCRQKDCPGLVTQTVRPHFHIMIDLDTRTHLRKTQHLRCRLADVPFSLDLGKQYRLIGVIQHLPGHFVAYCRKPSGRWLKCDDMQPNIQGCADCTIIAPIAAIYIAV